MFKWIKGFNKGDINKVPIVEEKVRTPTNDFKLDHYRLRKEENKYWFINRIVEWKKLSKHVVSAGTVDTFKNRLVKW